MLHFHQLSYWEKETYLRNIDFLIIGSGIVGLSTAIHLQQKHPKKKVCILERGYLPSGASTKNAGFTCIGSPSEILDDLNHNNEEQVFETVSQRWKGLNYLRELIRDEQMGYKEKGSYELFRAKDQIEYEQCLDQLAFLNQRLHKITGIKEVYKIEEEACNRMGFKGFNRTISNAAEGQIDTGRLMQSLILKAQSLGVYILNGIQVNAIEQNEVETNYGNIHFEKLAICNNGLAKQFLPHEDIQSARAQVLITSPIPNLKIKGIFHFDKGYYYFRNVGNRVLFGGARNLNFESEQTASLETTEEIIAHLKEVLSAQILPNTPYKIEGQWAGIMGLGKTKSPIVKQVDDHVYCGVRLGGMGIAIGSLVGKELSDLIS